MGVLTLKGLRYEAPHGYFEKERVDGNRFEVDLIFYTDLKTAGCTDNLDQTINYKKAEKMVSEIMKGPSVNLLETLVEKIGSRLFEEFNLAEKMIIRVRKLDPPLETPAEYSQVEREWNR